MSRWKIILLAAWGTIIIILCIVGLTHFLINIDNQYFDGKIIDLYLPIVLIFVIPGIGLFYCLYKLLSPTTKIGGIR